MAIWEHDSYRPYLMERLGLEGSRTGLRKKLAEAIPVHTTFVSQVLRGRAEFSLEQGESINQFLEHSEDESEYFILLLLKDRAGTKKLRERFYHKIRSLRDERINIKKRVDADAEISLKDRERFYSSFIYGAIHVLTAIPKYKTVEALTEALRYSRLQVRETVDFLLRIGVLKEEKGQLSPGAKHVHLGNESEMILKHHANWRLHTLSNLQYLNREDLHYSACLSLGSDDAFRVKESILQNLKSNVDLVSASTDDVAYVMAFDFYRLDRR